MLGDFMRKHCYFYAFFVVVNVIVIYFGICIFYSTTNDYQLVDNLYGYSDESFNALREKGVKLASYNTFIDCNASDDNFDVNNIELYTKLNVCVDVSTINILQEYFSDIEIISIYEKSFDVSFLNEENKDKFYNIVIDENYQPNKLERYINYEGEKVILNVNLNHDLPMYYEYDIVDIVDELVVVNPYNRLFVANSNLYRCKGYYMYDLKMCENYLLFKNELEQENIDFKLVKTFSDLDLHDEHATGLAIDLEIVDERYNLVEKIGSKYGFVIRYKETYQNVTGVGEEVGHFRYVGTHASSIFEMNISLEEYVYIVGNKN